MTDAQMWQDGWIIGKKDKNYEKEKKNDIITCPQIVYIQVDFGDIQDLQN